MTMNTAAVVLIDLRDAHLNVHRFRLDVARLRDAMMTSVLSLRLYFRVIDLVLVVP